MSDRAFNTFLNISLLAILIMAVAMASYAYLDYRHQKEMREVDRKNLRKSQIWDNIPH